jgi:hypothetical protein
MPETMQIVSAVYHHANIDVSGHKVVLRWTASEKARRSSVTKPDQQVPTPEAALIDFPGGTLRYDDSVKAFYSIGPAKGAPWDVDQIAAEFRRGCPTI